MDKKEIEKEVKKALVDKLDIAIEKVKPDSLLIEDLAMDSFGAVELIFELKDKFGIEIPTEQFNKIKKVSDIVEYISGHINKR
jgi:acyl carrier protein